MTQLISLDPRVQQAIVAGLFIAVGWVVNGWQKRRSANRQRAQRCRDVQNALLAEIDHYVQALLLFDLNASWSRIVSAMENNQSYIPVVPSERNDTVFKATIADIHVLPDVVIQPVVGYYNQVFAIEAIVEDLRSELFRNMNQSQRIGMYTDYIALKKEALVRGKLAVEVLRNSTSRG